MIAPEGAISFALGGWTRLFLIYIYLNVYPRFFCLTAWRWETPSFCFHSWSILVLQGVYTLINAF